MNEIINKIKEITKKGHFQSAVEKILNLVKSDEYRTNKPIKEDCSSSFLDGKTIKEMIEYDNLNIIKNSDNIDSIDNIDDFTYYTCFIDDKDIIINYLNEFVILNALRDLQQ